MASLRDRLKAQRETQLRAKTLVLPLQGWKEPRVSVRYKPVEWDRLLDLLNPAADAKAALKANLDALVAACDGLLIDADEDEYPGVDRDAQGRVSLAEALRAQGEHVHGEVRFDDYARDVLDLQVKDPEEGLMRDPRSAAETCLAAFTGAVSPELAVAEHAATLGAWMRGVDVEEADALLGG